SVLSNTSSTVSPNALAMRNASGSDGSNLPFSMALSELRETPTRPASSAWLHFFSARRTRIRSFMSVDAPFPPDRDGEHGQRVQQDDQHEADHDGDPDRLLGPVRGDGFGQARERVHRRRKGKQQRRNEHAERHASRLRDALTG